MVRNLGIETECFAACYVIARGADLQVFVTSMPVDGRVLDWNGTVLAVRFPGYHDEDGYQPASHRVLTYAADKWFCIADWHTATKRDPYDAIERNYYRGLLEGAE